MIRDEHMNNFVILYWCVPITRWNTGILRKTSVFCWNLRFYSAASFCFLNIWRSARVNYAFPGVTGALEKLSPFWCSLLRVSFIYFATENQINHVIIDVILNLIIHHNTRVCSKEHLQSIARHAGLMWVGNLRPFSKSCVLNRSYMRSYRRPLGPNG